MNIAIFGGAFDPVHNEHVKVVDTALSQLDIDKVLVVPSGNPPFDKTMFADFDSRVEMLKLAFLGNERVEIVDIERDCSGKSFSYDTVLALKHNYKADKWYFLIGSDCLQSLDRWYNIDALQREVEFVVLPRDGYAVDGCPFRVLNGQGLKVSSAEIKGRLFVNQSTDMIPTAVGEYIKNNGLYRKYVGLIAKLQEVESEHTFQHSARTAFYALRFASQLGLSVDQVFLAAILHDNAKGREGETTCGVEAVQHQFDGAKYAETEFSVTDKAVLDAIRTHTTGAPAMTVLQKLIYLSDILEDARDYPQVEQLRVAVQNDFDQGFLAAVEHCYNHIKSTGKPMHPLTAECLKYYAK